MLFQRRSTASSSRFPPFGQRLADADMGAAAEGKVLLARRLMSKRSAWRNWAGSRLAAPTSSTTICSLSIAWLFISVGCERPAADFLDRAFEPKGLGNRIGDKTGSARNAAHWAGAWARWNSMLPSRCTVVS